LTSDDLRYVLEELVDKSVPWYQLGLQLGVTTGRLDRIREQFSDPRDLLMEMLKTWLKGPNCSWNILVEALRSRSVGASRLAEDLETKYCPVGKTEVDNGTSGSDSQTEMSPVSEVEGPTVIPQSGEADTQGSKWSSDTVHEHVYVYQMLEFILIDDFSHSSFALSLSATYPSFSHNYITSSHCDHTQLF